MKEIIWWIVLISFGVYVLWGIVRDWFKTPKEELKYEAVWPFVLGIGWGILAMHSFEQGKPGSIIFALILGVALLYKLLKPSGWKGNL